METISVFSHIDIIIHETNGYIKKKIDIDKEKMAFIQLDKMEKGIINKNIPIYELQYFIKNNKTDIENIQNKSVLLNFLKNITNNIFDENNLDFLNYLNYLNKKNSKYILPR